MKTASGKRVRIIKSLAPQWKNVGYLLDFDPDGQTLYQIEVENKLHGPEACCQEMFRLWLSGNGKPATWETLLEVLEDCDHTHLVQQIRLVLGL